MEVEKLRNDLCTFFGTDYEKTIAKNKIDEAKNMVFLQDDKWYREKIFTEVNDEVLNNFDIELEFVENNHQHDLWQYFRIHTSSIKTSKNIGRNIRILVKHKQSGKYLGILALASDIKNCESRDKYIGWTNNIKVKKLQYIMNISCCVGLQPIAFNYNIGKLLVGLCFSKEVLNYHKNKYGHDLACITTFSINGKSIQYDRIPQYLKHVGETKGNSFATTLPDELYKRCLKYLHHIKDTRTLSWVNKLYKINKVMSYLDIEVNAASIRKRGVYIGFTSEESKSFMSSMTTRFELDYSKIQDAKSIVAWWKRRWAHQRYEHLKATNRLRYSLELVNAYKLYNCEKVKK